MRTLSQTIKDVLASDYGETKDVVIIKIPPQIGSTTYPETILYLANGQGVYLDEVNFQDGLRSISGIKFSLGKAPDNAEFTIENVSRNFGFSLTDFQRALDGSKIYIKRAFKTTLGWEPDTMFVGYIRDIKVDQSLISISASSDMSRRGTSVAGVTVTQRCLLKFNKYGSGIGPVCGWDISQPGNPAHCDKGLDTAAGCQSHGNQFRFGGVPAFTALTNAANNGYDGGQGGGDWGGGSGGGWCISLDSWVLIEFNGVKCWTRASELKEGQHLISVDKFGKFVATKIIKATEGLSSTLYTISTEKGYNLSCSPTHRVMTDISNEEGVTVNSLNVGDEVAVYDFNQHKTFIDKIEGIENVKRTSIVLLLELEAPNHLFMAAKDRNGAIISHNLKPIFTDSSIDYMAKVVQ